MKLELTKGQAEYLLALIPDERDEEKRFMDDGDELDPQAEELRAMLAAAISSEREGTDMRFKSPTKPEIPAPVPEDYYEGAIPMKPKITIHTSRECAAQTFGFLPEEKFGGKKFEGVVTIHHETGMMWLDFIGYPYVYLIEPGSWRYETPDDIEGLITSAVAHNEESYHRCPVQLEGK